ncbi:MAG TPA: DUF992 domain-containing protein [Stellaceae bacterium]|nr:DUF992 domain-containing protein [Stellaceae bacterium]
MHKRKSTVAACVLTCALAVATPALAADVSLGTLTCNEASGWGFVFGSSRGLNCVFTRSGGAVEHYTGTISKYGVDIGYSQSAVVLWGVVAATADLKPGSLAGSYGGVTGSASVGAGVGANVLVGGFGRSITLQPLSVQGNTGLNVAAGVEGLTLKYRP